MAALKEKLMKYDSLTGRQKLALLLVANPEGELRFVTLNLQ